nr:pyruvate kinase [Paenibacillus mangrovi]
MLTLDAKMISSTIIEQLLLNGMTIARINCAYDDPSTWDKMIESIRHAEARLQAQGLYESQHCRIYMDLAGPKIRINILNQVAQPLVIQIPQKGIDPSTQAKKGLIRTNAQASQLLQNNSYDFVIDVQSHERMHLLTAGDKLICLDSRHVKREFLITKVIHSGFEVILEKTAYIDDSTILQSIKHKVWLQVTNMETIAAPLQVRKSDRIKLLLKENSEGGFSIDHKIPCITVNLPEAFANVKKGHTVFIDDGKIQGVVTACHDDEVEIEITSPETEIIIRDSKGINLPDTPVGLTVPSLTAKDEKDLEFIAQRADMVGISFVHSPNDLQRLKRLLHIYHRENFPVIAKIETKEAVSHFSSILQEGLTFPYFGVMVARGDLAINAGFSQMPIIQEEILSLCRAAHTPVILATQVLDTLAKKGVPSRSELADLSLGSEFDCVMLNKGPFITEAVKFLQDTLLLISEVKAYNASITRVMRT